MAYPSVDALQKALAESTFLYAQDKKKAAGRALGTLVELVTFYLFDAWGFRDDISIERPLDEFAYSSITHNVEYTLHPILGKSSYELANPKLPITSAKILRVVPKEELDGWRITAANNQLLTSSQILRNGCTIGKNSEANFIASLEAFTEDSAQLNITVQHRKPFAVVECKRVGIEEGNKKGPQTIEKAKQGAYVARSVSSLQKVRNHDGILYGLLLRDGLPPLILPHHQLLDMIILSDDPLLLKDFKMTIGIVSNHGNWFTEANQNKELKVLAQAYDWLLFLTDAGLAEFVQSLLIDPLVEFKAVKEAFQASYTGKKGNNSFTKVKIGYTAHLQLEKYFRDNLASIEGWFNIIAPAEGDLGILRGELSSLRNKDWKEIHS